MASPEHEQLAQRHGFKTFDDLLAASFKLPLADGDKMRTYLAKHPGGSWFVWESEPDIQESKSVDLFPPDIQPPK